MATLLSLSAGERYAPLRLAPEHQKAKTLDAVVEQVTRQSLHAPLLVLFEDVHWADPSSIELLDRVIEAIERFRMLVIITFRPEFNSHWSAHTHVTSLTLNRLSRRLLANMVDEVAAGRVLPLKLREQIVRTTDGIPLFVEELTKSILESVSSDDGRLPRELPPVKIPETLHDSLMARLDRLASMKQVAQQAAAVGREFSRDLLAAISPLPEDELDDALLQLIDAGLVFQGGDPPRYVFKHALVQQAAYESMLRRTRSQLHARIAQTLEEKFSATVET
jgi:predicted ATPase